MGMLLKGSRHPGTLFLKSQHDSFLFVRGTSRHALQVFCADPSGECWAPDIWPHQTGAHEPLWAAVQAGAACIRMIVDFSATLIQLRLPHR